MDGTLLGRGDSHTEFDQLNQLLFERTAVSSQPPDVIVSPANLGELLLELLIPSR
jgi:hypothetical protein